MLLGTGSALPARILTNADFPAQLQTCDEWIRTRTGIRERRIAGPGESSFSLGLDASRHAIHAAGLLAVDLDLIICATATPLTTVPSNACRLQAALGCRQIGAFDLSGACTGFLQAMHVASQFIVAGTAENVLVVGSEVLSRTMDYTDRTSCILFGDGGGAVILSSCDEGERGLRWSKIYSDGSQADLIYMPSHVTNVPAPFHGEVPPNLGSCVRMQGREVYKFAVRTLVALVREALEACEDVALDRLWLVPHQVNERIIDAALQELPIPPGRVVKNLEHYGNTSAASVPIALDEAVRQGVLRPGDDVLLAAFGGGMTWGGAMLRL